MRRFQVIIVLLSFATISTVNALNETASPILTSREGKKHWEAIADNLFLESLPSDSLHEELQRAATTSSFALRIFVDRILSQRPLLKVSDLAHNLQTATTGCAGPSNEEIKTHSRYLWESGDLSELNMEILYTQAREWPFCAALQNDIAAFELRSQNFKEAAKRLLLALRLLPDGTKGKTYIKNMYLLIDNLEVTVKQNPALCNKLVGDGIYIFKAFSHFFLSRREFSKVVSIQKRIDSFYCTFKFELVFLRGKINLKLYPKSFFHKF